MSKYAIEPEKFLQALVERWDITPDDQLKITLTDVNAIANANTVLQSRKAEIDELNKLCDKLDGENGRLNKRLMELDAMVRTLSTDLKDERNAAEQLRQKSVMSEELLVWLDRAEYALEVVVNTVSTDDSWLYSTTVARVFRDLRSHILDESDIPF